MSPRRKMLSADSRVFSVFNSLTLACQRPTTKAQVVEASRFYAASREAKTNVGFPAAVRRLQHRFQPHSGNRPIKISVHNFTSIRLSVLLKWSREDGSYNGHEKAKKMPKLNRYWIILANLRRPRAGITKTEPSVIISSPSPSCDDLRSRALH